MNKFSSPADKQKGFSSASSNPHKLTNSNDGTADTTKKWKHPFVADIIDQLSMVKPEQIESIKIRTIDEPDGISLDYYTLGEDTMIKIHEAILNALNN